MKKSMVIPALAIVSITVLETVALSNGINGVVLGGAMALIGGIAGYEIKRKTAS